MEEKAELLGLVIGRNGIQVNPDKDDVVRSWPRPKSLTYLTSFVGLLQCFADLFRTSLEFLLR